MAYKHILIAVDLSPESHLLVDKAVSLARPYDAKLSLIHVDVNYSDMHTGLIDINLSETRQRISEETFQALNDLADKAGYPVSKVLNGRGDLADILEDVIIEHDVDMVVCGHHKDFWSKLASSARRLINSMNIDMLIVPLRDGSKGN